MVSPQLARGEYAKNHRMHSNRHARSAAPVPAQVSAARTLKDRRHLKRSSYGLRILLNHCARRLPPQARDRSREWHVSLSWIYLADQRALPSDLYQKLASIAA